MNTSVTPKYKKLVNSKLKNIEEEKNSLIVQDTSMSTLKLSILSAVNDVKHKLARKNSAKKIRQGF